MKHDHRKARKFGREMEITDKFRFISEYFFMKINNVNIKPVHFIFSGKYLYKGQHPPPQVLNPSLLNYIHVNRKFTMYKEELEF